MTEMTKIVKIIGDALSNEIFARSQRNLSDKSFAGEEMTYKGPNGQPLSKTIKRKWTITNKGALKRSGYKKKNGSLVWEVGYDIAYAYWVNYGRGPGGVNFAKVYDWAWYRRRESDFPDLHFPTKKNNPDFYRFYDRYKGGKGVTGMVSGHRLEKKVFVFAYYVMLNIKAHGTEPSFFFSDAIYTTIRDKKQIIANALSSRGYKVE